jgi:hypothetical protein
MAKGLNQLTGLRRTPDELAWLIRLRQDLTAQIDAIQRRFGEDEPPSRSRARIATLEEQARCVDAVIRLHPSGFDPDRIPRTRRNQARLYPKGELARAILRFLAGRKGKPARTKAIAAAIARTLGPEIAKANPERHYRAVLVALNTLREHDRVGQVPGAGQNEERSWFLLAME